jgi:ABC-type uncharacterized transport system ATPase subunit
MTDVERLAGRVVLLHGGSILVDSDLDALREEYSLAVLPFGAGADCAALKALEGCIAARERAAVLHAVFKSKPEDTCAYIDRNLGVRRANCRSVDLEEMFIELVGGQL